MSQSENNYHVRLAFSNYDLLFKELVRSAITAEAMLFSRC